MEIAAEEAGRIAALVQYNILDSRAEEPFDRLADIAAELFDAPIALVSLVDGARQWFKSKVGLTAQEMPRDWGFVSRVIARKAVLVIPDTAKEATLKEGGPKSAPIRFFAGAPLLTGDGHALGAVCVLDRRARKNLSAHERRLLQHLADIVMEQIELRRGLRRARGSLQKIARQVGGGGRGAADAVLTECSRALESLEAVHRLTLRALRKHDRVMTPKRKPAPASERRAVARGRERRLKPRGANR
ncbi:MAG: GAF domain-containing protein [Alphaproteobacteria bacterium]|nr:GAF domain-containing protein [Alphaproteobacteria bacterium]